MRSGEQGMRSTKQVPPPVSPSQDAPMPPPPSATYERLRNTIAESRSRSPVAIVLFGAELTDAQRLTINVFRHSSMRT